jgi:hypothetical protein
MKYQNEFDFEGDPHYFYHIMKAAWHPKNPNH